MLRKSRLIHLLLLTSMSILLVACQETKCIKVVNKSGSNVNAVIHRVDGGQALSLNPVGTLIGISKNGEICIRSEEESYLFSDHYKITGLGGYETKEYQNFDSIPAVVILQKEQTK